ncbi:MAG TPA: methyltransferase domain-containing protein [Tepidiformaceae bacterium]|nr:methyltransferase domain-containing protein [Tepidiformaceae bacterium]HMO97038.1 methyltransferase domain-containing protein [Tepidiformaceae bacterium]
MPAPLEKLAEEYAAWWIDFLGEHNHIGGEAATRWLLDRSGLSAGRTMLDCGAFVGAAARLVATETGAAAFATDLNHDFLAAGREMDGGAAVRWLVAETGRLPFREATFDSIWALDTYLAPKEFARLSRSGATLCLCCEVPVDGRGGVEAFIEEWGEYGWQLAGHKEMSNEATVTWREAEADLVRRRPYYEERYGTRPYLRQLDMLYAMVQSYERHEQGHGLFVFKRA